MKRLRYCCFFILLLPLAGWAQIDGHWVGTLTEGEREYPLEVYIKRSGSRIEARTFVHLNDTLQIEMKANGLWHRDRSLNLYDLELLNPQQFQHLAELPFLRTYQMIYHRSFDDRLMEGWWQEKHRNTYDPERRKGFLQLQRVEVTAP